MYEESQGINWKKLFFSERNIACFFWASSLFVLILNALDFFPSTRSPFYSSLVSTVLSMDHAPYEELQHLILLGMIGMLCSGKLRLLSEYRRFRRSIIVILIFLLIQEISGGEIYLPEETFRWMENEFSSLDPYAVVLDVQNIDLKKTDGTEFIEALAAFATCILYFPLKLFRAVRSKLGIPEMGFSTMQYGMLIFANLTGLWAIFHESGKHDLVYENMVYLCLILGILRSSGKLDHSYPCNERSPLIPLAMLSCLIMPVKFYVLYEYGYIHPFAY